MIKTFRNVTPTVPDSAFVAETALVMGQVTLGENCGVWPGAVIRGDFAHIRIGAGAVVSPGMMIPDRSLVFGVPAKIAGEVKPKQMVRLEKGNASYLSMFEQYRKDGI